MEQKTILITGVTAGIGKATAIKLAQQNHRLIITGRRSDKLHQLANQLKTDYKIDVLPLCFDIRNREETEQAIDNLPENWRNIDVLINNAGLAVSADPIDKGLVEDWERMIDTNIKGLLYITRKVSALMVTRNCGLIINIGSVAGKEVYMNGNVYCATKFAVDALTKGMRIDLLQYGIKVCQIAPGMVETEFSMVRFKGDEERAANVYKGFEPLMAEDIADAVLFVISRPSHVNISDMLIMPAAQASTTYVNRKNN